MQNWRFKILYDGNCPLCRKEIQWLTLHDKKGLLLKEDISAPGFEPEKYGKTMEELMAAIHGVFPDNRMVSGIDAMSEAYKTVGMGWVWAPSGWPVFRRIYDLFYRLFARYRLNLGRLFGRKCDDKVCRIHK